MIGNAKYHCSCVRYLSPNDTIWIIGVSVAVAVLLVLLIIIVVVGVICCRHQRTEPGQGLSGNSGETSLNLFNTAGYLPDEYAKDNPYNRRLPSDNEEIAMDSQYNKRLPSDNEDRAMEGQYNIRLPSDNEEAGLDSQYNKRLPSDNEDRAMDSQYNKRLPSDESTLWREANSTAEIYPTTESPANQTHSTVGDYRITTLEPLPCSRQSPLASH